MCWEMTSLFFVHHETIPTRTTSWQPILINNIKTTSRTPSGLRQSVISVSLGTLGDMDYLDDMIHDLMDGLGLNAKCGKIRILLLITMRIKAILVVHKQAIIVICYKLVYIQNRKWWAQHHRQWFINWI